MRIEPLSRLRYCLIAAVSIAGLAPPASADDISVSLAGGATAIMYNSQTDGCAPIDTPDIDPRAYRDDSGDIVMFTLHYINRALRGPDLQHLKIDCRAALESGLAANPAQYNDRRYMTATWTDDGRHVTGIVHHEYHAEDHKKCAFKATIECWFNSVLSFSSSDGGHSFALDTPAVVASAPFTQDSGQGRHRGFFNPSNIVSNGGNAYFMASTTGWQGQDNGVCLFRSPNPLDSASWRAFDGASYSIHYADPYAGKVAAPRACKIIEPFGLPVGSIVRHVATGKWIAVWMAKANDADIPVPGFYYATSSNLLDWSRPKLLMTGKTIHESACGGSLIAYPSLLDEDAKSRNFEDAGDSPWLYYVQIAMNGCDTGARNLVRTRLKISGDGMERRQ